MQKKLITGLSVGTLSLGLIIGLNPNRWSTLSLLGFYPPKICSQEKPTTQTFYDYQGYDVSDKFFDRGGEINQKIINRIKQDSACSLDFLLYLALELKELNSAKLLLKNGAVIRAGFDNRYKQYERHPNPLFYFVEDADTVQSFIDDGVDVNAVNKQGHNPLFLSRTKEVVQTLIDNGADVNAKGKYSRTPLFYAANGEVAQTLIDNGADVNTRSSSGQTPLFWAKNAEVARVLIDNGADVNAVDDAGRTPISAAIRQKHIGVLRYSYFDSSYLIDETELVRVLIDSGAKLNPQAENRYKTFLIDAVFAQARESELIQLLIDGGADVNARDEDGNTALFYASNDKDIRQLIANGADVNARNNNDSTPLMFAFIYENLTKAQWLIDSGADVNVKDSRGKTLLSWAISDKARQLLIDNGAEVNPEANSN